MKADRIIVHGQEMLEWENVEVDGWEHNRLLSTERLDKWGNLYIKFPNEEEFRYYKVLSVMEEDKLRKELLENK